MPPSNREITWELQLLHGLTPTLQAEWETHHAVIPGVLLVLTNAAPGTTGETVIGWCAAASEGMRAIMAHLSDRTTFDAYVAETPPDLAIVVVIRPRRLSLHRLRLAGPPMVPSA